MLYIVFFDNIRKSLFGRLSHTQVQGTEAIIKECLKRRVPIGIAAYMLATAYHEVGGRMVPVREGFASSNDGAIAAVRKLFRQGKIKRDYSQPTGPFNQSYYGRGLVQVTWYENYVKMDEVIGLGGDLVKNPDLALDPEVSAAILVKGSLGGHFRSHGMEFYLPDSKPSRADYYQAREAINGDKHFKPKWLKGKTIGHAIADYALNFFDALEAAGYGTALADLIIDDVVSDPVPAPSPKPPIETKPEPGPVITVKSEDYTIWQLILMIIRKLLK